MKGQKRRMSAGYPPARPNNWPGGQYTNPNGVSQGWASLSVNSGAGRESRGTAIGCNDGKISPRGILARAEPAVRKDTTKTMESKLSLAILVPVYNEQYLVETSLTRLGVLADCALRFRLFPTHVCLCSC